MPDQPDYRRRRIMLAAATAALLVGATHRAPVIGTFSITVDEHLLPQVAAEWTPPVALAMTGIGRLADLVVPIRTR